MRGLEGGGDDLVVPLNYGKSHRQKAFFNGIPKELQFRMEQIKFCTDPKISFKYVSFPLFPILCSTLRLGNYLLTT